MTALVSMTTIDKPAARMQKFADFRPGEFLMPVSGNALGVKSDSEHILWLVIGGGACNPPRIQFGVESSVVFEVPVSVDIRVQR